MVQFSQYVSIAYDVAESKGFADQLRGAGTQDANRKLMSQLGEAYNEYGHSKATESEARRFLRSNLGPP